MSLIKSVFDQECAGLRLDMRFYKQVCDMEAYFVNRKQEHIEFFGGALTGVQVVRFTNADRDKLFVDILQVDDALLEERLYALERIAPNGKPVKVIRQDWFVSSDVFNLSCVWLIHAIHNSPLLDKEHKKEAKIRIALYLLYKFMTSRLFMHFRYPADPAIAAATFAALTNKYSLKRLGSWGACLRDLAEKAVSETSIVADVISRMDDDDRVIYMLNDLQGRIRDMLKNIYNEHKRLSVKGERITSSTLNMEMDGESILKDKTQSLAKYTRYLHAIIGDRNTFIRQELVDVIASIMDTMNVKFLRQSLEWASDNFSHTQSRLVERCIDMTMEHSFSYLEAHRELARATKDIPGLISKLRGAYMSSRSVDPRLMQLRDVVGELVKTATGSKNEGAVSAARTGFMLYLSLRAWTMRHYSNQ